MDLDNRTQCDGCAKMFDYQHTYKKHYRETHQVEEGNHKCGECGNIFKNRHQLKQHSSNVHRMKNCDICGLEVSSGSYMRHKKDKHIENVLPPIMHQCGQCTKIFVRKNNLERHEKTCCVEKDPSTKIDTSTQDLCCSQCGKSFEKMKYLNAHKLTHGPKVHKEIFPCKYCDKSYTSNFTLSRHMSSQHPNPDVIKHKETGNFMILDKLPSRPKANIVVQSRIFKCDQCPYECTRNMNIKRHMETVHKPGNQEQTPTHGRKRMAPSDWSETTKRIYAKNKLQNFNKHMEDIGLGDYIENMLLEDFKKKNEVTKCTEKEIINMISDFELSDRKMIGILQRMQEIFGTKSFSTGIRQALIDRKKKLTKYFKREETTFEGYEKGATIQRHLIYTEYLGTFLDFICLERGVDIGSSKLAIGMDSGQKRMLVTLTVDDEDDEDTTVKDTSTRRVIILAHVDDIPETYANMSKILEKLNIHNLYQDYHLVSDLKLYNIILGLTACSSRHGCPFCNGRKGPDGVWIKGEDRTLETLLEDQEMWEHNSGDRAQLKEFNNVEFKPLLMTPNNKLLNNDLSTTSTLSILPPPGLHLIHLGPVNHIWKALGKQIDLDHFEKVLKLTKTDRKKKNSRVLNVKFY
jgi:hypothetical protein